MHFVGKQKIDGTCQSIYNGSQFQSAYNAYRLAIDMADEQTANISWYFNCANDQQHIGTVKLRNVID